jgi:transposase
MALRVGPLTADEAATIGRVARSRTEPARRVARAQMIPRAASGESMGTIAAAVGGNVETVRLWGKRFNAAGLQDRPRRGRPAT